MVNVTTEIIFLVSMAIACICGYIQITKLDVNKHTLSLLDDLLLFICIPAFFLDTIFGIVPAVQTGNGFSIAFIIVQVKLKLHGTRFLKFKNYEQFFLVISSSHTNTLYNRWLTTMQ